MTEELVKQYMPLIIQIIAGVIGVLLTKYVFVWVRQQSDNLAYQAAVTALEAGVQQTYEDTVKWAKEAAADGKLSKNEREDARKQAIRIAFAIATDAGQKVLEAMSDAEKSAIISAIVNEKKN